MINEFKYHQKPEKLENLLYSTFKDSYPENFVIFAEKCVREFMEGS